jgi:hypothetical protein
MGSRRVRAKDGQEYVLLSLADYEALVIAAEAATAPPVSRELVSEIIARLAQNVAANEPGIDLDDFLAAYDAAHPAG